jgi:hypothetical protein
MESKIVLQTGVANLRALAVVHTDIAAQDIYTGFHSSYEDTH